MLWLFFFKIELGMPQLASTDWLSPWMHAGPSQGIPIIRSLYRSPRRYSQHCFIVTNSEPTRENRTKFCWRTIILTQEVPLLLLVDVSFVGWTIYRQQIMALSSKFSENFVRKSKSILYIIPNDEKTARKRKEAKKRKQELLIYNGV